MANRILIVGESGKGKTTSMRTLDPASTFIINVENKELPWRGYKKSYQALSKENPNGNMVSTDNAETILKVMDKVNTDMPHIKVLVIDDAQYVMANEYMRKAMIKGYEKYSEIGRNFFLVVDKPKGLRDDLTVVYMMHSEVVDDGSGNKVLKAKTIGKIFCLYSLNSVNPKYNDIWEYRAKHKIVKNLRACVTTIPVMGSRD